MMGKEGLHGWVDRKSCDWKYGVDFHIPDTTDFVDSNSRDVAYHLLITEVKKDSLAEAAGLKPTDKIVGVGEYVVSEKIEKIPFPTLLEELATTGKSKVTVQLRQFGKENILELELNTPENKAHIGSLQLGTFERMQWAVKMAVIQRANGRLVFFQEGKVRLTKQKRLSLLYWP